MESSEITILPIELEQVYSLRNLVLRPNQPIESCYYQEDSQAGAFHIGAIFSGSGRSELENPSEIIGIASFYPEGHPALNCKKAFRLRGMAVSPSVQGLGIGSKIVTQAIEICKKAGSDLLWCNARESAAKFYQRLGFESIGESFSLPNIGEHYLMSRPLKQKRT